jgi:hypothetical protein
MRQPHPESFYKHLNASTRAILDKMNRRGTYGEPGGSKVTDDDETHHLIGLATKVLALHSAFATRGVAQPRHEDGRSVPLALALKAMAMLEHQR